MLKKIKKFNAEHLKPRDSEIRRRISKQKAIEEWTDGTLIVDGTHIRIKNDTFMKTPTWKDVSFYSYKLKGTAATIQVFRFYDFFIQFSCYLFQ